MSSIIDRHVTEKVKQHLSRLDVTAVEKYI